MLIPPELVESVWGWVSFKRLVTVTAYNPATDGPGAVQANVEAFAVGYSAGEQDVGDGATAVVSRVWHLRTSMLGAVNVTARATITEAGGAVWVVERYQVQGNGTRIRCECHRKGA